MQHNNYEFNVLVNGNSVKEYKKDDQTFIEGKKGSEYSLQIKNNSWNKILAVITVDGLSVIDGKEGSYKSRGYIIDARSSLVVDGWRENLESVRKFVFSDSSKSYATKQGKGGNEGIIGVAIFEEKDDEFKEIKKLLYDLNKKPVPYIPVPYVPPHTHPRPWQDPWFNPPIWCGSDVCLNNATNFLSDVGVSTNMNNAVTSYTSGSSYIKLAKNGKGIEYKRDYDSNGKNEEVLNKFDLGTGYGETKKSVVNEENFKRSNSPVATLEIRYATRQALKEMGIVFDAGKVSKAPTAFPGEFCKF